MGDGCSFAAAADVASAPGETVEAGAQTIAIGEHFGACVDGDVTPSHRDSKPGASFVKRAERGLKPEPRVARAVADGFGNIETHAAQGPPNLSGEIPISLGRGLDQRPSRFNELKDRIEEKLS
jgi:hypothetical protein